jgi:hypothetical protein
MRPDRGLILRDAAKTPLPGDEGIEPPMTLKIKERSNKQPP